MTNKQKEQIGFNHTGIKNTPICCDPVLTICLTRRHLYMYDMQFWMAHLKFIMCNVRCCPLTLGEKEEVEIAFSMNGLMNQGYQPTICLECWLRPNQHLPLNSGEQRCTASNFLGNTRTGLRNERHSNSVITYNI